MIVLSIKQHKRGPAHWDNALYVSPQNDVCDLGTWLVPLRSGISFHKKDLAVIRTTHVVRQIKTFQEREGTE